jgi:DNA helicase-2/ATP-dependent DNA helicase PcrA
MKAKEHPHYTEEKQHLNETISFIDAKLARSDVRYGSDPWSTVVLTRMFRTETDKLRQARQEPYFGRVDWLRDDDTRSETFYIGKHLVQDDDPSKTYVYSWAGTLAGDLYYQRRSKHEAGKLLLKRTFQIDRDELTSISDEYVDDSLADQLVVDRFTDQLLLQLLQASRGGTLQDIVATIQEQQYAIITLPKEQIVVVQGVPGSGKTSVALHRIAYLLYHHRDDRDFSVENLLILGPSPIFLAYIANVLPALGERRIPQQSFDAWMTQRLDTFVDYEPQDVSLELLLDPAVPLAEKIMRYRNARNKGSLKMAQLLERYVEILYHDVLTGKEPLVCTYRSRDVGTLQVERKVEDLQRILDKVADQPFNERSEEIERHLTDAITREMEAALPVTQQGDLEVRHRIEEQVEAQVHQYFSEWRKLNASVAYRRLLRTRGLLQEAGEGLFSGWDLELLRQDAPTAFRPFRFSDLAALLYLKILLDGTDRKPYDHIVIDEAQDITPLQFKVLSAYSRASSMTVLGDLAQGIYPHHGVGDWEELTEAVGNQELLQQDIRQSYRSTQETVAYANAMLERSGAEKDRLAEPIARPGSAPVLHPFGDRSELVANLPKIVQSERDQGHNSIAIVCRSMAGCRTLAMTLEEARVIDYQFVKDRNASYRGGIALIPSYLTKGLEFDAVIVADADAETYAPQELEASLLYVVLTRALHALHICWTGILTPLLDERLRSVAIRRPLTGHLAPQPVTVEAHVSGRDGLDADWCVERLAGADKLILLQDGKIDETVLEVLIRSFSQDQQGVDVETVVQPLDAAAHRALEQHAAKLEAAPDAETQRAAAFVQLVYGLLRNPMRRVGLQAPQDDDGTLADQMILLVTLFQAVREGNVVLSVGPRTTHRRALQAVDEGRRELAQRQLSLLIDHGIVEEASGRRHTWIQVPQAWLHDLLALGLGHTPETWDGDLLDQIAWLPEPLDWTTLAEVA